MKKKPDFTRTTLATFATMMVSGILSFLFSMLIARLLGPDGKGLFTIFTTSAMFLLLASKMGIGEAALYYIGSKLFDKRQTAGTALCSGSVISITVCLIFCLYIYYDSDSIFIVSDKSVMYTIVLVVVCQFVNLLGRFIFLANNEIAYYNTFGITLALLPMLIILFFSFFNPVTVQWTILLFTGGLVFNMILLIYTLFRKHLAAPTYNFTMAKKLLNYGFTVNLGNIAKNIMLRNDIYLIAFFLTPAQVGLYSIAAGIMDRFMQLPESIATILFQRISGGTEKIETIVPRVYTFTIAILLCTSLFLALIIKPLIIIFFPGFEEAILPALFLIPGTVMLSLYTILSGALIGTGHVNFYVINTVLATLTNIILNIFLIPAFGIIGAAISSTICYALAMISGMCYFSKVFHIPLSSLILIHRQEMINALVQIKNIFKEKKSVAKLALLNPEERKDI